MIFWKPWKKGLLSGLRIHIEVEVLLKVSKAILGLGDFGPPKYYRSFSVSVLFTLDVSNQRYICVFWFTVLLTPDYVDA